jgi:hypothetical protein
MRYRIIQEANGYGDVFYEVHFYKPVKVIFGFRRWKWEAEFEWQRQGDYFHFKRIKRFATLAEATRCVDENNIKRSIHVEGEVVNVKYD